MQFEEKPSTEAATPGFSLTVEERRWFRKFGGITNKGIKLF